MTGVVIASFILLGSFAGLTLMARRKLPLLLSYPRTEEGNTLKAHAQKWTVKVMESKVAQRLASPDVLAQNILSKTRIMALKTESKAGKLLERMRKNSKDNAPTFSEDYWKQLKNKN